MPAPPELHPIRRVRLHPEDLETLGHIGSVLAILLLADSTPAVSAGYSPARMWAFKNVWTPLVERCAEWEIDPPASLPPDFQEWYEANVGPRPWP